MSKYFTYIYADRNVRPLQSKGTLSQCSPKSHNIFYAQPEKKQAKQLCKLLANSDHSLNKSTKSGMVRAAGLVCDVVSLQKLLELLGIVAWTIVTPDDVG